MSIYRREPLTHTKEEVGCYKGQLIEHYGITNPLGGIPLPGDVESQPQPQRERRTSPERYARNVRRDAFWGIPAAVPMFDAVANAARKSDPLCGEFEPLYMISRKVVAEERRAYLALHGCCGGSLSLIHI